MAKKTVKYALGLSCTLVAVGLIPLLMSASSAPQSKSEGQNPNTTQASKSASEAALDLSPSQLDAIKIEPVGTYLFPKEKEAVGSIDFDEELSVQVFPPYQGKIITTFVTLGDDVKKGQPMYTIDSPDLVQAESTVIGAAASYELTTRGLARARELFKTKGVSERDLDQAINDQQTAEGALRAARDAVRVFGKTEAQIDQIITTRAIDPALMVKSPVEGRITSMNAPPGLLVQPGSPPAPYSVADISTMWMLGNVTESDSPSFHTGQPVRVTTMAYPGRVFDGKISKIYASVDPNTHRVTIRSDIADPQHELRPGMLADFVIQVQEPVRSTALPVNGVVRNGDGTMAAWVTADRKHFVQRIVKIGIQKDRKYQILEGLNPGELAVSDGAIFLSNMLQAPPSD